MLHRAIFGSIERHEGDLGAWPVEQLVEKLREAAL